MKRLWALLFLTLLSSATVHAVTPSAAPAHAANPSCAKAVTRLDKAICASPELAAANDKVAAAFKGALAQAPAELADGMRADQSAWLRNAAVDCNVRKGYNDCLLGYFAARTEKLAHLMEPLGGRNFLWRMTWVSAKDKPAPVPEDCDVDDTWGFSTLFATWPQLASGGAEAKAFNLALEAAARNFNHPGVKGPIATWTQALGKPDQSVTTVRVELNYVGKKMIDATIESNPTGHCDTYPTASYRAFNWLLAEQREMEAKDIFIPTSDWRKILEKAFREVVAPSIEGNDIGGVDTAADLKALLKIFDNPHNWQLDPDGLSIVYSEGKDLSHADIPGDITIPWDELKSILQPTFEIPEAGDPPTGVIKGAAGL